MHLLSQRLRAFVDCSGLVINDLCPLKMDRVKRFTGKAKGALAVPVRRDEDESLVLFGELYKHEKERDANLLEPMFSVEFEAVQGESLLFRAIHGFTCSCWY